MFVHVASRCDSFAAPARNQYSFQITMNMRLVSSNEIFSMLKDAPGMAGHVASLGIHAKRYERLFATIAPLTSSINSNGVRILDVGPWWQTALFRSLLSVPVDTMGLGQAPPAIDQPREGERYYQQDLNRAVYEAYRSDLPNYDIIVMAEVLEHLPVAATHLLKRIKTYLKAGGFLVLTTPNGVALKKRIKLLEGKVPYTLISEDPAYPSHFREYTLSELLAFARTCGFTCVSHKTTDDWYWRYNPTLIPQSGFRAVRHRLAVRLHEAVEAMLPDSLKESIVLVLTH